MHADPQRTYPLPQQTDFLVGTLEYKQLEYEDTFATIARVNGVGFAALKQANAGVDPWLPGGGTQIVLPTAFILPDVLRQGIVVNLSERRLYYFDTANTQLSVFPAGIGREGSATPTIKTQTVARIENPEWTPPASVRREHAARGKTLPTVVPARPDNPLGKYAIKLASPGYFIHGTNQSFGVGQRVSHGCIRLYNLHIESLIKAVPNGTSVQILNQPHKVGWHQGSLYLESHPNAESEHNNPLTQVVGLIIKATNQSTVSIDWRLATQVARAATGLPTRISN